MAYKALYRTYRPNNFDEVVAQQHIVRTLQNAVEKNKIAHAYLFCGPRGTGKTSIAKLLAKAVNCESTGKRPCGQCANCLAVKNGTHPDVVEIDAASNNGVDEIRNIIEKVKYSPIQGKYKVYIIDEVHMLSSGAFNALLKTLEEPPEHVIFVLATTEPHKVLPTIISRCQRYDFTKVPQEEIQKRLEEMLEKENIDYEKEAVATISILCDGGMRDAWSIMDQALAYSPEKVSVQVINEIYGITTTQEKIDLLKAVFDKDVQSVLNKIRSYTETGIDIMRLTANLIDLLKECVIYGMANNASFLKSCSVEQAEMILKYHREKELLYMIDVLMETSQKYKLAANVVSYFEVCLLKLMSEGKQEISERQNSEGLKITYSKQSGEMADLDMEKKQTSHESKAASDMAESHPNSKASEVTGEKTTEPAQKESQEKTPIVRKDLDLEFFLSLVVGANKAEKEADRIKWNALGKKMNMLEYAKITNMLRNSDILASGKDFIIISADYQALANQINDEKELITDFCKKELDLDKQLFTITPDNFKKVTKMFIERRKSGTLPSPADLSKKESAQNPSEQEDPLLHKLESIFGEENIEITEEN